MTAAGFAGLTRIAMDAAAQSCGSRLLLSLEGGYAPQALADSVQAVIRELNGSTRTDLGPMASAADPRLTQPVIQRCTLVQAPYWPGLTPD